MLTRRKHGTRHRILIVSDYCPQLSIACFNAQSMNMA